MRWLGGTHEGVPRAGHRLRSIRKRRLCVNRAATRARGVVAAPAVASFALAIVPAMRARCTVLSASIG
jgi:hypothetical protein